MGQFGLFETILSTVAVNDCFGFKLIINMVVQTGFYPLYFQVGLMQLRSSISLNQDSK